MTAEALARALEAEISRRLAPGGARIELAPGADTGPLYGAALFAEGAVTPFAWSASCGSREEAFRGLVESFIRSSARSALGFPRWSSPEELELWLAVSGGGGAR